MKIFLDQNVSARVAGLLRDRGHDAVHAVEVGLNQVSDDGILTWCRSKERIAITMDADFHALLATSGSISPSVVRIRIESLPDDEMLALIEQIVLKFEDDLTRGAAITVKETSIRIHALPLVAEEESGF